MKNSFFLIFGFILIPSIFLTSCGWSTDNSDADAKINVVGILKSKDPDGCSVLVDEKKRENCKNSFRKRI